jgi:hypothetical protein
VFEERRSAALRVQECGRIDRAPHDDGAPIYIFAVGGGELRGPKGSRGQRPRSIFPRWATRVAWAKGVTGTEAAIYMFAVGEESCAGQRGHGDRGRDLHFCGGRGELRGPKGSRAQRPRSTFLRWARRVAWAGGVTGTEMSADLHPGNVGLRRRAVGTAQTACARMQPGRPGRG